MRKQLKVVFFFFLLGGLWMAGSPVTPTVFADEDPTTAINDVGAKVTSHICADFLLDSVPVGNFFPPENLPIELPNSSEPLKNGNGLSQRYNNPEIDGYCVINGVGFSATVNGKPNPSCCGKPKQICTSGACLPDPSCLNLAEDACFSKPSCFPDKSKIFFGHDGIDIAVGNKPIVSTQPMLIILSKKEDPKNGWGESIIGATRANRFSEEIITYQFHHLDAVGLNSKPSNYHPTRRFNACETVSLAGVTLGIAGHTGNGTGVHLHYGMRRWRTLAELKKAMESGASFLFGIGYAQGDDSQLIKYKYLDPLRVLSDSFTEFDDQKDPPWFKNDAQTMRYLGLEFGEFDGSFGAALPVQRGPAARWFSAASQLPLLTTQQLMAATEVFPDDIKKGTEFFNYVQNLSAYPKGVPVVNPNNTCQDGTKKFCPSTNLTRASAIKMAALAFYEGEYLKFAKEEFPDLANQVADNQIPGFADVPTYGVPPWFASYVYFGLKQQLVKLADNFNPLDTINRVELAKWVIAGQNHKFNSVPSNPCLNVSCQEGAYCEGGKCVAIQNCVSSENHPCTVGGGTPDSCTWGENACGDSALGLNPKFLYNCNQGKWGLVTTCPGSSCQVNPGNDTCATSCTPGENSCGNPALGLNPNFLYNCNQGKWGLVTTCPGSSCQVNIGNDTCAPIGACSPSEIQTQACPGGTQTRSCQANGQWGSWGTCTSTPACSNGQTTSCGLCGVATCSSGQWGGCQSQGVCSPGTSQSQSCNGNGTQNQTCTNACQWGPWSSCVAQCQDVYLASASPACYTNTNSAGSPTLCMYVQQSSGSTWHYQVCKQTGTFDSSFDYHLQDDNHTSHGFGSYTGSGGSCTPLKNIDMSYLSAYGLTNGAGLMAHVSSPAGCTGSSCQYHTDYVTVYKQCQ